MPRAKFTSESSCSGESNALVVSRLTWPLSGFALKRAAVACAGALPSPSLQGWTDACRERERAPPDWNNRAVNGACSVRSAARSQSGALRPL